MYPAVNRVNTPLQDELDPLNLPGVMSVPQLISPITTSIYPRVNHHGTAPAAAGSTPQTPASPAATRSQQGLLTIATTTPQTPASPAATTSHQGLLYIATTTPQTLASPAATRSHQGLLNIATTSQATTTPQTPALPATITRNHHVPLNLLMPLLT